MKQLVFWLDVVSPYAWLAFEQLPQALEGISHSVEYRPLLLGAVLQHWGQKGPAEISAKRDWAYREVRWRAQRQGVPLQLPLRHPFRSLALQRLLVAAGASRRNVELVLRHVWIGGYWLPARAGYRYVGAAWVRIGPAWHFRPAHWSRY